MGSVAEQIPSAAQANSMPDAGHHFKRYEGRPRQVPDLVPPPALADVATPDGSDRASLSRSELFDAAGRFTSWRAPASAMVRVSSGSALSNLPR